MNFSLPALTARLRALLKRPTNGATAEQETAVPGREAAAESRWRPGTMPVPRSAYLIAAAGVTLLIAYYAHSTPAKRSASTPASAPAASADTVLPPLGKLEPVASQTPAYPILSPDYVPTEANQSKATAHPAAYTATGGAPASPRPADRALTGAVFSRPAGATPPLAPEPSRQLAWPPGLPPGLFGNSTEPPPPPANSLTTLLKPETVAAARASQLPDRRLLLSKGAFIDCTLQTAIDSSLPGFATCLTPVDILGTDGTVVLLERGTTLIGEMHTQAQAGSARVFVLWSEARTPTGVVVPLASPGTDALGRSGVPGEVDRHFWDRFGAALLVSAIDGTIQAAASHSSRGGNTVVVNPNQTTDIATEVLRSTIAIPPTIRVEQGKPVQVIVARDIDFSSVYALRRHTTE
jgi:type IV secretion system protein VirB10